jgi:hypothetical protein
MDFQKVIQMEILMVNRWEIEKEMLKGIQKEEYLANHLDSMRGYRRD